MCINQGHEKLKTFYNEVATDCHEILLVYLFGSRIDSSLGPLSDYDFGIFCEHMADHTLLRAGLYLPLATRLGTEALDIVILNNAPIELAFSIVSYGHLLYERDVKTRVDYEARAMGLYFDYLPTLRTERREILEGKDRATRIQRYRETFGRTERTLGEIRTLKG